MGTKLDLGACRMSLHCCLCPSRLLSSGCIHRPVLPRWGKTFLPVAAPGLNSTVNVLETHIMTRGVFPNRLSRSHCKGLSLSSSLRPKRCGALIGCVETSVDSEGNYKHQKGLSDLLKITQQISMCLLTKVHVL